MKNHLPPPILMLFALACSLGATTAHAFKLQAWGSTRQAPATGGANRQAQGFMRQFTEDIHERITGQAYAMAGLELPDDVVAGVRWNDNPPAIRIGAFLGRCGGPGIHLSEGMECWVSTMRFDRMTWEALTQREKSFAPARSHFGDMQFLHAMASRSGESAADTRRNILRWSEFAYRVARGEIDPRAKVYEMRRAKSTLDGETGAWIGKLYGGAAKQLWSVQDMFLAKPAAVRLMAFGSILHLVEDSYSAAHVRRESSRVQPNGCLSYDAADPIVQFQTYVGQDTEKHGVCDDAPDWLEAPRPGSPIEVLAEIARAYHENQEWPAVKAILEDKVFRLADATSAARPGRCFEWHLDETAGSTGPERVFALDPSCRQE